MYPGEIPLGDPNYTTCYPKNIGQLKVDYLRMSSRHRVGGYIGFVDGHVDWFPFDDLNTPYSKSPVTDYNYPSKCIWDPFGPVN